MPNESLTAWVLFNAFVLGMLALDLGVFHRRARTIGFREALISSIGWIALAAAFALGVHFWLGRARALEFATGYLVEESLSVDNLFVFLLIFRYFRVPARWQYKVLFAGIVGALVMRGAFIFAGVTLLRHFHWMAYVFGAFLVFTGARLAFTGKAELNPDRSVLVRMFRRCFRLTPDNIEGSFFVRWEALYATPLLLTLLALEATDLLFAVDSVPAVLAITRDPFIVYSSIIFAILGLRSLYFVLAGMLERFAGLHYGVSVILVLVGAKMLVAQFYVISTGIALGVVAGVLAASVAWSLVLPGKETA
jgi:tellurite resistance protein TerC